MGIAILNELQDRLHTIAIAGTNLLSEDFRLKKTVEQFHTIAASSPVLSKIDQLVQKLFDEQNMEKEISLIEAITLVDAVVCTQADYTIKKENQQDKQNIEIFAGGKITDIKYSELEPIITALTTTGSGRYEIIYNTYKDKEELFKDFRILPLLIQDLNDSYSELADLIEKILTEIGEDVIFLCKRNFDAMGGKDMIRRLNILEKVVKDRENDFYISLLENSSAAIREKAITLLRYSSQNIDMLIHFAETEKGKCKTAALTALSMLNEQKSVTYFIEKAKKKPQTYLPYLINCDTEEASDILAEELEKILNELLDIKEKTIPDKLSKRAQDILPAIDHKYSDKLIAVLERYDNESKNFKIVEVTKFSIGHNVFHYKDDYHNRVYSTDDWAYSYAVNHDDTRLNQILHFINGRLIYTMLLNENENYIAMIKHLYKVCGKAYLPAMLVAEFLTEPEKTYDMCVEYLNDSSPITILSIRHILGHIIYKGDGYYFIKSDTQCRFIAKEMDIRWIKSLTQLQSNIWGKKSESDFYDILEKWTNYDDEKTVPLFRSKFREFTRHNTQCFDILQKLGETDFKTLVFLYAKSNIMYVNDHNKIIELLKGLPFTVKERAEEAKMILEILELRIKKSNSNLSYSYQSFKEELEQIIIEGKEE